MSGWKKSQCNESIIFILPNKQGVSSRVFCRANIRHEGSHIFDLIMLGSKFIRIYSDQIEEYQKK